MHSHTTALIAADCTQWARHSDSLLAKLHCRPCPAGFKDFCSKQWATPFASSHPVSTLFTALRNKALPPAANKENRSRAGRSHKAIASCLQTMVGALTGKPHLMLFLREQAPVNVQSSVSKCFVSMGKCFGNATGG